MLIYPLWLVNYYSGSGEQLFRSSMEKLGATVKTCPLEILGSEYEIMSMIEESNPDLIFHIPYKDTFRTQVMGQLTKNGNPTLCWNGDDEWIMDTNHYHNSLNISKDYKWIVTTHEESIPRYYKIGIKPILSQWGFSSSDWKYRKLHRDIDVYFCGASNPKRDTYLKRVASSGVNYSFDGPGYGHHKESKNKINSERGLHGEVITGKVPFKTMLNKYLRSKISVSFLMGASGDKPYSQVKARCFEIPATGSFQLASKCLELERFFKIGEEIDVFENEQEMLDKIQFYLEHDSIRERMAKKAMERNKNYSYEAILKRLFKEIGI